MKVPASGPDGARILIVGEAPGEQEVREGRPFVGPAGTLLRNFLMEVGINPEEVLFTNICKYRPPENKLEKFFADGGFPQSIVVEGLCELEDDIKRVQPNVILACGNFPLWALASKARWMDYWKDGEHVRGYTGISDWRGSILDCTLVPGMKVIPTFHPSYIAREGMKDHGTFKCDLARVKKESEFPEVRRPEKAVILVKEQPLALQNYWEVMLNGVTPEWEPYSSREQIRMGFLADQDTKDPTTLDIEYIGSKLLCVGMTQSATEAFVFPTENLSDLSYVGGIIRELPAFNAQNSMFDASILEWHYQLPIMQRITFDTMLAANAAQIELPKGLDYLVSIYTDQPYYKGMVDWKKIKTGQQSLDTMYVYNGADVWTQHEVMLRQIEHELSDAGVKKTFDFLMALLMPLWEMSRRGVRIDLELMKSVAGELDGESAMKEFELMFLAGRKAPINVKSNDQVGELLFKQLGMKPLKMNKTGPACDDKTMAALQLKATNDEQRKAIELIRGIRNARDLKSKFFNLEFDKDGRMRGHYDPTKTVTGRLASRKFYPTGLGTNQQNIPRDKRARRAFIADQKKVFCYADLEKAESLVVAHLTGDQRMLFDHQPGQNAHRNLGADLFSKEAGALSEDEYYLSKKTRHAGNYMQGWVTFQRNVNQDAHKTGVSIGAKEAKYFIGRYKDLHPGLPLWWRRTETELFSSRTLFNLLGRRRVFYGHIRGILPEAVAFVPQSTVGDTLNVGLLNLEGISCPYTVERGLWERDYSNIGAELLDCGYESLMQIHDAVVFQCWERDLDRVLPLVNKGLRVPLTNPRTYEDFTIPVEINADLDPEHVARWKSCWGDCKTVTLLPGAGQREVVLEESKVKKIKVYTGV
jgi:uracil-DNA glycosylase family 4